MNNYKENTIKKHQQYKKMKLSCAKDRQTLNKISNEH